MTHSPRLHRSLCAALGVLLLFWTAAQATAAEARWKKERFVYTAQGKPIRDFMREFGASQGLTVVVAKEVEGVVNGKFDLLPESLIALMAANFGFVWYYDGSVLHISPSSDVRTEVVRLGELSVERFRQSLERLDIPDARYPITYDARQGTALVSGPSRYVDLVLNTARAAGQGSRDASEVRLVPLKYAWAADYQYSQGSRQLTLPGVASVMTKLFGGEGPPRASAIQRPSATLEKLRGLGLAGNTADSGRARVGLTDITADDGSSHQSRNATPALPQFVADGRTNAVLVRDVPERLSAHESAIRALDVKPGLVEIEARIIEVNAEDAESLGIDWRARSARADLQVGRPGLPRLSWGSALVDGAPAVGPGGTPVPVAPAAGVLTTVLGDAGRHLIARVTALAQEGRASLLSSPKVATLDNVEAVLEDLSTFYVRVQGNLDVDLFNVSSGTSMRVTPLIVAEGGARHLKLAVRIEDGAITAERVDGVPVVRRSVIQTQSMIADGQALLIAGYAQESTSDAKSGVPGLQSLPLAGWLFKNTDRRKAKVERFFLLTPRVLTP